MSEDAPCFVSQNVPYFVSQEALVVFNELFNLSTSGDFEGSMTIKLTGYTIHIFSSGELITIYPDDPADHPNTYLDIEHVKSFLLGKMLQTSSM